MRKIHLFISLFLCFIFSISNAQTVLETSFDDYTTGTLDGQDSWSMEESGSAEVVIDALYVHNGNKGVHLSSSSVATVQLDHVAYDKSTTGLMGNVYLDCWIKIITPTTDESFTIAAYDLTPDGSERRACQFEFTTAGVLKVYNGGSKIEVPLSNYTIGEWTRLSARIDYSTLTYEAAVNGNVLSTTFDFRESYVATEKGRDTDVKEYHLLRFLYEDDISDIAIDDIYVGTTAIADIPFSTPSLSRTVTINQPYMGTIILDPAKETYEEGDVVTATVSDIPTHYVFSGWTGSLSGDDNPKQFTISANATIGADIIVDASNPPAEYTITLNQSTGGTISISPESGPYYEGNTVTFTASTEIGYQFDGWNGITGTGNSETVVVSEDLIVSAIFTEGTYSGRTVNVSTKSELEDALDDVLPGDQIILADGIYDGVSVGLSQLGGSSTAPVTVMAQNQGQAKITGSGQFSLTNCAYITFSGLDFDVSVYTLFKLTGCNNIRITKNIFKNSGDDGSKLILIGDGWDNTSCVSQYNRVDHNLFDGKSDKGAWLVIDGSHGGTPQVSQYDRIDHNHFRFNMTRATNEKETIRIGMSDLSLSSAFCTVENNLFEECDGDPEIISVKSCDNYVRNNTFVKCLGTVSLRHGDRTEVSGNYFLGQGKTAQFTNEDNETSTIGCGGVRVYGKDHKIFNNYFEGLTGSTWDAACTLTCGDALNNNVTNASDLTKHYVIENLEFTHNTLVNNASDIEIGYRDDWGKAPINCLIANNIIVQDANPVTTIKTAGKASGVTFADNIIYTTGTGSWGDIAFTDVQALNIDPLLELSDARAPGSSSAAQVPTSTYKLTNSSPAINASTANTFAYITTGIEGQALLSTKDLGADEYSSSDAITNGVLDATHVGPDAVTFQESGLTSTPKLDAANTKANAFPNPFVGTTTITFEGQAQLNFYNISGQFVQSVAGVDYFDWIAPERGVYLLVISHVNGGESYFKLMAQ